MLMMICVVVIGIVCLVWSADRFVEGAAALARRWGVSELVVGMVIVGFGTSLPEMAVSALSSWQGAPGLALGNAFGSNIANITLILGAAAAVCRITIRPDVARREIPALLLVTLFAVILVGWNGEVSRFDAMLMLGAFVPALAFSLRGAKSADDAGAGAMAAEDAMPAGMAWFWTATGLVVLVASSQSLVWSATVIARVLGVSELAIGLTVVAVGTSLPELASSVAAARKNRHEIAVGNVIGSNVFNTLAVVGIAGMIKPMAVDPVVYRRDLPAMAAATLLLFFLCRGRRDGMGHVTRLNGAALLALFAAYTAWVFATAAA